MNALAQLTVDETMNAGTDSVGSSGPWDSDIYQTTVEMAYMQKSDSGALGIHLTLKGADERLLRQSVYVTGGDAKGNLHYYVKDGKKNLLPGYVMIDALALLSVGKPLSQLAPENRIIKVYDFDAQAEVPAEKEVLVELLGQPIYTAVQKQVVDKNVKGADGSYVPSGETKEVNEIDKFFRAKDKMTQAEILANASEAAFFNTWKTKWEGQVRNRAKGAAKSGTAGAPVTSIATAKPTGSLFG